jgi:hypothetical protein
MKRIEKFFGWGLKHEDSQVGDAESTPISYRKRLRRFLGEERLVDNLLLYVGATFALIGVDLATRYGSVPGVPASLMAAGFAVLGIWAFRVGVFPLFLLFAMSALMLGIDAYHQMQIWFPQGMLHL